MTDQVTKLAEQVMRLLNGGDYSPSDSKWDIREIAIAVEQASAKLIRLRTFEEYRSGEPNSPGQYLATFTGIPIQRDTTRNLSYIDIPAKYISLPKGRGVHSIGPEGNEFVKYIPLDAGALNFTNIRQAPFLQGNSGYWLEGSNAYFSNELKGNVVIKLITGSDLVADMESDIVTQVYSIYRTEKLEDKVINAQEE
jgi:hypothetical protein